MTSHSEHFTWTGNWEYLRRCFPSLERAPQPVHDGFHERFSKLRQDLVREAIQRARQSRQGNALTVEQLGTIYGALVPRYDTTQPSMASRIIGYWAMYPRRAGAAFGPRLRGGQDSRAVVAGVAREQGRHAADDS